MTDSPSRADFLKLEKHFDIANAAVGGISWEGGYPQYPDEVWGLATYIQQSPWCDYGYKPSEIPSIVERISEASIDEIRTVLTGYSQGEKFCDGYFHSLFQEGQFGPVMDRARELTRS